MPASLTAADFAELRAIPDRTLRGLSLLARVGRIVGEEPIVVGGYAVETYTRGAYSTWDIDAILLRADAARACLLASGARRSGRHFLFEDLDLAVEFPGTALPSREAHRRVNTVDVPGGSVRMLGLDDLLVDRLCALVHGGATDLWDSIRQLVALHRERLDPEYLRRLAAAESVEDALDRALAQP